MSSEVNLLQTSHPATFAIDASSANKQKRTGVENYAFHLIEALKLQPLQDGEQVVLFSPTPLEGTLASLPSGWQSYVLAWPFKKAWMQGRVTWELFRRPADVLFVPAQGLPHFGRRLVTTIHDVAYARTPHLYEPSTRKRIASTTKRSIKKAVHLLTVSQFTKQELMSLSHVPGEKITVTPLAADTQIYHRLDAQVVEKVLQTHRLSRHFFLSVGRLEKKKNTVMLIRAFELFKQNRGIGDPFELVLIGEPGFGFEEIKAYITNSSARESIRVLGYLPDADVAALMNIATAFLFPSWYEGFGIPTLEAMSCGTAVFASDIPAHHEVAADAALFISPEPEAWAKQMSRIAEDPGIRDALVAKGTARAAQFSWEQTAKSTWEVLRSLV
ncbi:MAG: glycosyltransferase family 1 protein [Patescibacteria group bacterium]